MALLAITILGTFFGTILAVEAKAWMPYVSASLLRATIARFPAGIDEQTRARWSEEIEADLASFEGRPLGGLLFATRLRLRGGRGLAAELALQQALEAGSAVKGDPEDGAPAEQAFTVRTTYKSYLRWTPGGHYHLAWPQTQRVPSPDGVANPAATDQVETDLPEGSS